MTCNRVIVQTTRFLLFTVVVLGLSTASAEATILTMVHQGTGFGSLNGVNFPSSAFSITSIADTLNRESLTNGWSLSHTSSMISITGVATCQVVTPTRTYVNFGSASVGYSRFPSSGQDLFIGPSNAALGTWDMLSPIGPFVGDGHLIQWADPQVVTSCGVLVMGGDSIATFTATPEPTTLAMLGFGMAGILLCRKSS